MARPLRLQFPGAVYHITSRGNARSAIYHTDIDYFTFLRLFGEVCERYNWSCHAYCLMTNHYHLVLETVEANLASGMRRLNGVYTQSFNRQHRRVGHVFQGRYKAILVDKDAYLLEVVRYVLLNPVRAHMTKTAGQYRWSSYRAMIGKIDAPEWLAKDWVLSQFAKREKIAQTKFIQFIRDGKNQPMLWENLRGQIYLGDEHFVERLASRIDQDKDLTEVPRRQRRGKKLALRTYRADYETRDEAIIAAFQSGQYTQKEIADYFGLHYTSVSKILKNNKG